MSSHDTCFPLKFSSTRDITHEMLNDDDEGYGHFSKLFTEDQLFEAFEYRHNNTGSFIYKLFNYSEDAIKNPPKNLVSYGIPRHDAKKFLIGYLVSTPNKESDNKLKRMFYKDKKSVAQ